MTPMRERNEHPEHREHTRESDGQRDRERYAARHDSRDEIEIAADTEGEREHPDGEEARRVFDERP